MAIVITLVFQLISLAIILAVIYFLGRPIIHGAIYFPTTPRGVREIVAFADPKPGQKVVDLGSGDGRILVAFAELGATAVGYEINPVLVRRSRRAIAQAGLSDGAASAAPGTDDAHGTANQPGAAMVHWESFWRADLSQYDTVIVYGIPYIMRDLQRKLERELRPGTKIISNAFVFPGWQPVATERKIFLYVRP